MPSFCAVVGCGKRGNRDGNSFFRIPCIPRRGTQTFIELKTRRRFKWILALRRADMTETKLKHSAICDRHFISGRPAKTEDIHDPDWVPSLHMGYTTENSKKVSTSPYVEYLRYSIVDQNGADHSQQQSSLDTNKIKSATEENKASLTLETDDDDCDGYNTFARSSTSRLMTVNKESRLGKEVDKNTVPSTSRVMLDKTFYIKVEDER